MRATPSTTDWGPMTAPSNKGLERTRREGAAADRSHTQARSERAILAEFASQAGLALAGASGAYVLRDQISHAVWQECQSTLR